MAKFLFSLIIILLVGIGSALGGYIEHFEQGSEHFYAGRFERAVAEFEESLRLNPLLDEIDIHLAREAMKYLEAIALEDKYLAEEIERLRAERVARRAAKEKIAELELEERIRLGIEEKERISRLIEEEEKKERLQQMEARKRELERPKLKVTGGITGAPITYLRFFNLDFERGDFPARDGRDYPVKIRGTDGDMATKRTYAGFTLMPLEELSFTFEMSQDRTWGGLAFTRDFIRDTVDQLFPSIILPHTLVSIPGIGEVVFIEGGRSYKEIGDDEMIIVNGLEIPRKMLLTWARPIIVDEITDALVDWLGEEEPEPPDPRWRDIDLAHIDANFLGFKAKIGRQHLLMGLPVSVDEVIELIGIGGIGGLVGDLIGMVVGHADAIDLSYRTPPIMGLVSPRVRYFGMKLDDADPGICRIRSDHYYTGGSLGIELSVEGMMDMLGFELPGLEIPEGFEITVAEAARHLREDKKLRDEIQSDILRLPVAVYVRQSGRKGVWGTAEGKPWRHYEDGPRYWVRSEEVGGYGWVGILPIVIPGDRMSFFAAAHMYRSGDNPETPNISEAFDPLPHDMLFMPLDPADLLAEVLPIELPIELPKGFDIGTNMRYQLYAAGFRPSEDLTLIGLYAEMDRARPVPHGNTALDEARMVAGKPRVDKGFLQMAGLASVFTWRDIGFALIGLGIRPEDSLFDTMQDMADELQIDGELWTPEMYYVRGKPLPELLHRSKEWMRILIGMITIAPTEHTSLIMGAGWIDPADHIFNFVNAIIYYDAEAEIEEYLGGFGDVTMNPVEEFTYPLFDDPAMVLFMQFGVHF